MTLLQGAIAATRYGMGARPGEIKAASSDPRGWLKEQIRADAATVPADGLMSVVDVFKSRQEIQAEMGTPGGPGPQQMQPGQQGTPAQQAIQQRIQRESREGLQKEVEARARHAVATKDGFAERWARFWSNHFTVAARNAQLVGVVGPFEREAIRPNVFGSFSGLLGNASFHPAMLMYLDANRSIGPSTEAAKRRNAGLNENLAREILELHTLGVGSGYTQADIIEFAKALTGWTVGNPQTARLAGLAQGARSGGRSNQRQQAAMRQESMDAQLGKTVFLEQLHEPGARELLGKRYTMDGRLQAAAILDDLARHPATAHHVAVKLVRHFVSDVPPPAAVAKIEDVFKTSNGDLSQVAIAMINLDEAWGETSVKFKTPEDLLVSAARATGADTALGRDQRLAYTTLAQQPFQAPSPAGWPDDTASWSGSDAIMKRLEWANAASRRMRRGVSPSDFLDAALGPLASEGTRKAVSRAESAEQGFTLALMSPEFQRR